MKPGKDTRTILGIDPGTNILGFGIIRIDASGKPQYVDMGVLDLRKVDSPYTKLEVIHEKVGALCDLHHPDDMAIESPFYGKNAQVIFKLGRAQGAAMIAGISTMHSYISPMANTPISLAVRMYFGGIGMDSSSSLSFA